MRFVTMIWHCEHDKVRQLDALQAGQMRKTAFDLFLPKT